MGAISQHLTKPLFTLEKSTNSQAFVQFLKQLRKRFPRQWSTPVTIVLDNAKAHKTQEVKNIA
jgi:transposase